MAKKARRKAKKKATKKPAARRRRSSVSTAKKKAGSTKGGRPPFEPTDEQREHVAKLAGLGLPHDQIRLLVKNPDTGQAIGEKTLRRHFEVELVEGIAESSWKVADSLFKKAMGNGTQAVTAGIWWTKIRMGWKERVVVDVEVKSGVLVSPGGMTPEDWIRAAAKAAIDKKEPGAENGDEG